MADFFQTYFVDPVYYNTGYNPVNTAAFAVILIAAVFLTYRLIKIMKIKIDRNFFFGIIPFIAMGGILRAYEDLLEATGFYTGGFLDSFVLIDAFGTARNLLLISPMIYVVMFLIALASLVLSNALEKTTKKDYWKVWFFIGAILDIAILSQMGVASTFAIISVIGITIFWILATAATKKLSSLKKISKIDRLLSKENMFLINVHLFEAATTFVALQFPEQLGVNYFEQHVVAGLVINLLGPVSFFLLKLIVVPVVLYYFDKDFKEKDEEKKTFLKIIVLILGMGPGIRNFLRMVMGV